MGLARLCCPPLASFGYTLCCSDVLFSPVSQPPILNYCCFEFQPGLYVVVIPCQEIDGRGKKTESKHGLGTTLHENRAATLHENTAATLNENRAAEQPLDSREVHASKKHMYREQDDAMQIGQTIKQCAQEPGLPGKTD